jgi:hypothetical protein
VPEHCADPRTAGQAGVINLTGTTPALDDEEHSRSVRAARLHSRAERARPQRGSGVSEVVQCGHVLVARADACFRILRQQWCGLRARHLLCADVGVISPNGGEESRFRLATVVAAVDLLGTVTGLVIAGPVIAACGLFFSLAPAKFIVDPKLERKTPPEVRLRRQRWFGVFLVLVGVADLVSALGR